MRQQKPGSQGSIIYNISSVELQLGDLKKQNEELEDGNDIEHDVHGISVALQEPKLEF